MSSSMEAEADDRYEFLPKIDKSVPYCFETNMNLTKVQNKMKKCEKCTQYQRHSTFLTETPLQAATLYNLHLSHDAAVSPRVKPRQDAPWESETYQTKPKSTLDATKV